MRSRSGCLLGLLLDAARELHDIGFAMVEVVTRMTKAFNSLSYPHSREEIREERRVMREKREEGREKREERGERREEREKREEREEKREERR